jgi:hypothetical protein
MTALGGRIKKGNMILYISAYSKPYFKSLRLMGLIYDGKAELESPKNIPVEGLSHKIEIGYLGGLVG